MNLRITHFLPLALSLCFSIGAVWGQPTGNLDARRQQLESMKIAFITNKLTLTPAEAQKFWPVYNSCADAIENNRRQEREIQKQIKLNFSTMDEKEMEQLADKLVLLRKGEGEIFAQYHKQFITVLPIRKVLMLYRAEEEWKVKLLEEIRNQRTEGAGGTYRPNVRP